LDGKIIVDDEFNTIIKKNLKKDSNLIIFSDCCHSGTLFDLKYNYNEDSNITKDVDIKGNVYYISGCRDSQVSRETFINNQSQGALTNAIIASLTETMTWHELMQSIRTKLQDQTPQLSTSKILDINKDKCIF
jgi:hypothetical protein